MQFSTFAVLAALTAAAQAVNFTVLTFATVTAGQPFDLTWTGAKGPVTLTLKNGPSSNLQTVSTIASGLSGTSFSWPVPSTLINLETYAIEISDGTDTNYSTQFQLIGGVTSTPASVSRTATGTNSVSTGSVTSTGSVSSVTTTQSLSSTVTETSGSSTLTRTTSAVITRTTASSATTPTSTPPSGAASGLASNLGLVLLAAGALFMIN